MSTDKFCEPCKAFQRGSRRRVNEGHDPLRYAHHDTLGSFHQALEIGCIICARLQASLVLEDTTSEPPMPDEEASIIGPTTYERASVGSGVHDLIVIFRCKDHIARLVLGLWDSKL